MWFGVCCAKQSVAPGPRHRGVFLPPSGNCHLASSRVESGPWIILGVMRTNSRHPEYRKLRFGLGHPCIMSKPLANVQVGIVCPLFWWLILNMEARLRGTWHDDFLVSWLLRCIPSTGSVGGFCLLFCHWQPVPRVPLLSYLSS